MFRSIVRFIAGIVVLTASAHAVVPRSGPRLQAHSLTAMPAANTSKPLRAQRWLDFGRNTFAWSQFVAVSGGTWHAAWDIATGVPSRIWGEGIAAPGAIANASLAEQFARKALADHVALLAPGASMSDFELVSNTYDGDIRSVGFVQRALGFRVVGGQVSFRFKHDRLFVIGSEAFPNIRVAVPRARLAASVLRERALRPLRAMLALPDAPASPAGAEVVLPLVADDAVLGYRLVRPLTIDGGADGRYLAYVDAVTAEPIAVHQLNSYASGMVLYRGVDRHPSRGRVDQPATRAHVILGGAPQTTSVSGSVSWSPDTEVSLQTSITGDLATVVNKAMGNASAAATYTLQPGGQIVWDASGSEHDDAQLNAYIVTNIAKEYVRAYLDPTMPTLDEQMTVNVNIAQNCNAFFDGTTINFFQASAQCQNTALVNDVVFHEYGHRVHTAEIIPGVGDFDGAMAEGASDFFTAIITDDPGMGRGFFHSDAPLRDLDPDGMEWVWPTHIGEIHNTGKIYGGAFWDLRKALIAELGPAQGIALVNRLYLATLRRAINIPTSLIETLASDDDDGNLANGTPHECTIRAAFGRHGLRTASGTVIAPGTLEVDALAIGIHVKVTGLSERCTGDNVVGADVGWLPPFGGVPAAGSVEATPAGANTFFAQIPLARQDSIFYTANIRFGDGSSMTLADNLADPFYQLYQGQTVKLYCADFENGDPLAGGWTTGTDDETPSPWQWGVPSSGPTDPPAAYSGMRVLGQQIGGDYAAKQRSWVRTPPIDVRPYSDVRVHYRRWLAVEDSYFDKARVTANDKQAWLNYSGDTGDSSSIHHVDKEWRFHDVPLSGYFRGHTLTVGWEITSDEGLELGGWHLDDVCVVANPYAICGDGIKTPTEQCDNGAANADRADTCRTDCRVPLCGDQIADAAEECDDGAEGSEACTPQCTIVPPTGGCCSTHEDGSGSLAIAGLVVLILRRRRSR